MFNTQREPVYRIYDTDRDTIKKVMANPHINTAQCVLMKSNEYMATLYIKTTTHASVAHYPLAWLYNAPFIQIPEALIWPPFMVTPSNSMINFEDHARQITAVLKPILADALFPFTETKAHEQRSLHTDQQLTQLEKELTQLFTEITAYNPKQKDPIRHYCQNKYFATDESFLAFRATKEKLTLDAYFNLADLEITPQEQHRFAGILDIYAYEDHYLIYEVKPEHVLVFNNTLITTHRYATLLNSETLFGSPTLEDVEQALFRRYLQG